MSIFVLKMLIYIMLVTVAKIKKHPELITTFCVLLYLHVFAGRAAEIDKLGLEYCTDRLLVK